MISRTALIAVESFGEVAAERAGAAIGRGLTAASPSLQIDLCPLERAPAADLGAHLGALRFDARMRAARAVVLATARLDERTLLAGASGREPARRDSPQEPVSAAFELATRARQSGVPTYAVTACNELSSFDARMLDLQVVLTARDVRSLRRAGERLAGLL